MDGMLAESSFVDGMSSGRAKKNPALTDGATAKGL